MANVKKRVDFYESEEGQEIQEILDAMTKDTTYNTAASYSANTTSYPDNLIPFTEKHMQYLNTHPNIDSRHYISNLRLVTRQR